MKTHEKTEINANELYLVVRNHEEQYSLWLSNKSLPLGWEGVGDPMPKTECLQRIKELWKDMRPLSLRGDKSK